jgi:hypothetical protein
MAILDSEMQKLTGLDFTDKLKVSEALTAPRDGTTRFSALWQADRTRIQRMAPIEFIGRYMRGSLVLGADVNFVPKWNEIDCEKSATFAKAQVNAAPYPKGSVRDQTGNRFGDRCVPKVLQKRLYAPLKSLIVKALRAA